MRKMFLLLLLVSSLSYADRPTVFPGGGQSEPPELPDESNAPWEPETPIDSKFWAGVLFVGGLILVSKKKITIFVISKSFDKLVSNKEGLEELTKAFK